MKTIFIKSRDRNELVPLIGEALLLYDKVVIDISDFILLQEIIANIEKENLTELIRDKAIEFIYQEEEIIATINDESNGQKAFCSIFDNIVYSVIGEKEKKELLKQKFVSYEEKIEEVAKPFYKNEMIETIQSASSKLNLNFDNIINTSATDLENRIIIEGIEDFVHKNFTKQNYLINYQLLTESPKGVGFGIRNKNFDSILDASKRQIILNTNLRLAYLARFGDISCENLYSPFISMKLKQLFIENKHEARRDFLYQLFDVHDFMDVKYMIRNGIVSINEILDIRKKHGKYLREWINELSIEKNISSEKFAKEYSKILLNGKNDLTMKTRLITFGLFRSLNAIMPILGTFISAGYEFGIKEVTKEWQPKIFFNSLNKLMNKRES